MVECPRAATVTPSQVVTAAHPSHSSAGACHYRAGRPRHSGRLQSRPDQHEVMMTTLSASGEQVRMPGFLPMLLGGALLYK